MHATARRPLWVRVGAGLLATILFLTNTVYPWISLLPAPPIVVAQESPLTATDSAEATPAASVATPAPTPLDPLDHLDSFLLPSSPSAEIVSPEEAPESSPSATPSSLPETLPEDQILSPSPSPLPSSDSTDSLTNGQTTTSPAPSPSPTNALNPITPSPLIIPPTLSSLTISLNYPFVGNYPVSYGFGEISSYDYVRGMQSLFGVKAHDGIDFAMPEGTPVLAADSGVVRLTTPNLYGQTIVINHSWGSSYYGHLSQIYVTPGTPVSRGTIIGLSGNTGVSTGAHLHFGIRPNPANYQNGYQGMIDPLPYLAHALTVLNPASAPRVLGSANTVYGDTLNLGHSRLVSITDRNEKRVKFDAKLDSNQDLVIHPNQSFAPGKYIINTASDSGTTQTEVSLGVLTLNYDHAPYQLGDMAHLQMAALTETGFTICDANLSLTITKPDDTTEVLTTSDQTIRQSPSCGQNNVTDDADYQTYVPIDQVGTYTLTLLNLNTNDQIVRSFTALNSPAPLTISRRSATRINPFLSDYQMEITLNSPVNQTVKIVESLPSTFNVSETNNASLNLKDDSLTLTWSRELKANTPETLVYRYQAPPLSPYIFLAGPLEVTTDSGLITESNVWQIASDAATYALKTGYYVGTGIPQKIVVGFAPQYVMIKSTSTIATVFKTTAMPVLNTALATATADSTGGDITFDSTGFTITGANTNAANVIHQYVAVTGSDCSSSGVFCVGSYQGSGAAKTITTGFQPDYIMAKSATTAVAANFRTSSMGTNVGQYMIATTQDTTGILFQTISSNSFTVGTTNSSNAVTYYYVAFKNVTGSFGVGTYTGNAADNRAITGVGFTPNMVLVKNANAGTAVSAVWNITQNYGDTTGYMTATANLVDAVQSLDSDGFTIGTNSVVNGNGNTVYYVAFGSATADPAASGTFKMATGTFTGTAALQQISGLEFAPDLVIIKGNTTQAGAFRTRVMGGDTTAYLDAATANFTGGIISLNNDGFTLGTSAVTNNSGTTYYYTAFGNAYNPMTKSGAADFFIGAYYGNGIDSRNITNLPFQPDMVTVKRSGATGGVFHTVNHSGDTTSYFAATADLANSIQSLRSDGFQVGTNATVNTAANTYWYFGFKDGAGFATDTYTGTGSTATISTVGFQSNFLWVKAATAVRGVERTSDGATDSALPFINVGAVTGTITGITSTGFTVGTAAETNTNGTTYRYVGWRKTITISGTANGNSGATVKVAYNSTLQTSSTTTISGGSWSMASGLPTSGDIITVWVDNVADSLESSAVTYYSTGDITGMVLNTNVTTVGSSEDTSLSLTNLNSYDCTEDEDIMYQSASSQLKVEGDACAGSTTNSYTSEKLSILSGDTLTLGTSETITTYDFENAGTVTVTGNGVINTSHDWANTGTFTSGTSTVNLTGADSSTQTLSGNTTFYNLSATTTSNSAGRTIRYTAGTTTTVTGTWTMTGATSKILTLESSTSSAWSINPTITNVSYITVSYSTNTGLNFCASNSTDGNNNTAWNITSNAKCSTPTTQVSATSDTTTTSTTYTLLDSMTTTPGAGDYMVHFSTSIKNTRDPVTGGYTQYLTVFVNGAQVNHTERAVLSEESFDAGDLDSLPVAIDAYVSGVTGGQDISIYWKTTGGTATAHERTLVVQQVLSSEIIQSTATSSTTTTSTSDTALNSMSVTPGPGNYLVFFGTSMGSATASTITSSIYVNGSQVASSIRSLYIESSYATSDTYWGMMSQTYVSNVTAGQTIEVDWKTTAGTATALQRTLVVQRVSSTDVNQATATSTTTTTSSTDSQINSLTLTPGSGDYLVFAGTSYSNTVGDPSGGSSQYLSLYVASSQVAASQRKVYTEESLNEGSSFPVSSLAYTTGVGGADSVTAQWRTTYGTLSGYQRNLITYKITTNVVNTAPNSPTSLTQKTTGDVTLTTGSWHNSTSLKFSATASDTDNPDTLQLCIEIDQIGTSFSNTEDSCGTGTSYVGSNITVTHTISVTDATEYHWQARVKDGAGAYSSWVSYDVNAESARDIGVDTTAPTGGTVYDGTSNGVDASFATSSLSSLSANWASINTNVSGLLRYEYSIGTSAGATNIKAWTDNSTATSVTTTGLTLQTSQLYYFNVRAVDNAGNTQTAISSNGQLVSPSLSFSITPATTTFNNLSVSNSYSDTQTTTLTTSTNAYNGYIIRAFTTDLLKNLGGTQSISNFSAGSYATPASWNGSETGFGYTSSDTTIQGSNKFASGTLYAPFSQTGPGDIVADHTTSVSGSSISNESFNITYKVKVPASQAATNYTSTVVYTATAQY